MSAPAPAPVAGNSQLLIPAFTPKLLWSAVQREGKRLSPRKARTTYLAPDEIQR
jgi:hypothetical protein